MEVRDVRILDTQVSDLLGGWVGVGVGVGVRLRVRVCMCRLVDWTREDLQRLLVHRGAVLHGARLQGQDLSRLGFGGCCLRRADLRDCILIQCDFEGASMEDVKLEGADMSDCNMSGANHGRADLRKANLGNAMLKDAILPAWNSELLEGVRLTGATGWMPAN